MSHSLIISLDKLSSEEVGKILLLIGSFDSKIKNNIKVKFNDLINLIGFNGISEIKGIENCSIMLDPKWHDIPNTLTNYFYQLSKSPLKNQVDYVTLHANGGRAMIEAAKKTRDQLGLHTKIIAVTALTSLEKRDTEEIYGLSPDETVLKLSRIALESGADGIVCSPLEIAFLREKFGYDFISITPGVRFESSENIGDQKRIATPLSAIKEGANHIVMGRDILSGDIKTNIERFFLEINSQ